MRDKFRNKNGDLTHYALACGYIQIFDPTDTMRLTLWHEGNVFHIRLFEHSEHKRVFWHSFDNLTAARKYWHQTKNNLTELSKMQ